MSLDDAIILCSGKSTKALTHITYCPILYIGMCGGCIHLNTSGNAVGLLKSPQYPFHYPNNLDCVWKLIAPRAFSIRIAFQDFDIQEEENSKCNHDFVDVFNLDANGDTVRYVLIHWHCTLAIFIIYEHTYFDVVVMSTLTLM